VFALVFLFVSASVFAQSGSTTATLNGVVTDKDGNVPGASVLVLNVATGVKLPVAITNNDGAYSFPGLAPGKYKVTISLTGYKTAEIDVTLNSGSVNSLPTKLDVGTREEIVKVTAGTDLVRTDTPTVTTTVNADFIQTLPRSDRNALSFLVFLPGVTVPGAPSAARGSATISNLPQNTINILIDGISTSNLLQSTDGFFSMVTPRLDAVEEVSLTTASAGADASGQGAVQVRFVTRSGTNKFETSLYWYLQNAFLNSNTYFNRLAGLPVPQATNYTYGGRVGGPIILPKFDGRGRAFFFFNQEEVYNPAETSVSRTMIRQSALDGTFCYGNVGQNCVNLLTLATQFGQVNTLDSAMKSLLDAERTAATKTGTIEELVTAPNTATLRYLTPSQTYRHNPTTNITVNLSSKNRLQGSYYWQGYHDTPDRTNTGHALWPGFPAFSDTASYRSTGSISLRSTVSTAMVNEVHGGWQASPQEFFTNTFPGMFDNQGGFAVTQGFGLTNAAPGNSNSPSLRDTINWSLSDQFNWLKGPHSLQFGGDYTRIDDWNNGYTHVPTVTMGLSQTLDPAELSGMFAAGNFPGSSSADRNNARALYALLIGDVTSIGGTGRLNEAGTQYVYNGNLIRREAQDDYSMYAQDTWRWKPTLTLTLGARYQVVLPMQSKNGVFTAISTRDACGTSGFGTVTFPDGGDRFCNMFQPGVFNDPSANTPTYVQYSPETKGYNTDFNNIAPNLGAAWRPNVQSGWLRTMLGDPEIATVNGGYTRSFNRERVDRFLDIYSGNPGQTVPATRSTSSTAFPLLDPGETYPKLYRNRATTFGPPAFQTNLNFPIAAGFGDGAFVFNPDIAVPYTDSWNVSFQRAITKDTVAEIRYVGNTNRLAWTEENWNAINVFETKWLTGRYGAGSPDGEFEKAEANLRANVLAGRGGTFAYFGPGSGTVPLPIVYAHICGTCSGAGSGGANNPANYNTGVWTNATFVGALDPYAPDPYGFATNLYLSTFAASALPAGAQTRLFNNALAAGYPANYWVLNSQLNTVVVQGNSTNQPLTTQVILSLRRRLAQGLAVQGSYTWQRNFSGTLSDFHIPRFDLRQTGVPHAIQMLWTYDVPVGRGKKYGANMNAWLDGVAGGWTFSGTARFQTQSFVLRNAVLSPGFTLDEARKALRTVRFVNDPVSGAPLVFNFPEDIYTNTRLAYATDETQKTFYAPGTEPYGPLAIPTADGRYRYFMRAGGVQADGSICNFVYSGDCGTQELWFTGRWFGEMDFRLAKQFQLPGRARFEMSAEVFNATKALNFPNTINPGTGSGTFQITTTQSGARTAQLVWRVSW